MSSTRKQVIDELVGVYQQAEREGRCGNAALTAMGVPSMVCGEVMAEALDREAEGWWKQVERTIDGELVRRSIVIVHDADPPA